MNERTLESIQEQLTTLTRNYESFQKKLSDNLIELASQVGVMDHKKLAKRIKEQADEAKNLSDIQTWIKELKEKEQEKIKELESQDPKFETLKLIVEAQKETDINWFRDKLDSGDYTGCTKQEIQMLESGIDEIIKTLSYDATFRLTKLISQIKDKTGDVISCNIVKNENGGFDGIIEGVEGKAFLQTIVAGGPIQQLHYRTLIK
jgi:predicted nuclease with TOPRIM domain